MKDIITKYNLTGECQIDIPKVIAQWNNRCVILRWRDEYRIVEYVWRIGIKTGETTYKFAISEADAKHLITALKLNEEQSFLKSGKSYHTARTEAEAVIIEQQAYIKRLNKKVRAQKK